MGSSNKIDISRFDPTNASDDQIRLWLFAIIQAELEKDDAEIDKELIDECSDCEAFLSHSNPEITQEEYATGLARIKERAQAIQADGSNVTVQAKPKKRHFMRVAVYSLAATLAVAILSVSVVAAFNGSAAWEVITSNIQQLLGMEPGDTLESDKVTLVKGDLVVDYKSVEEALKAGGFDGMLYPTELPEGVRIERILHSTEGEDERSRLIFMTNSNEIGYAVYNYEFVKTDSWETTNILEINGLTFYITYIQITNEYQAGCNYNDYQHIINSSDYNDLIKILDNIKEMQ